MRHDEALPNHMASLSDLDTASLRLQWKELFNIEPATRISRDLLIRAIAYCLQENVHGGLSKAAQRQLTRHAEEIRSTGSTSVSSGAHYKAGTKLIREWQGNVHEVVVLDDGLLWSGKKYRSLSEIARAITGTRWSGPRFFGTETPRPTSPTANVSKSSWSAAISMSAGSAYGASIGQSRRAKALRSSGYG